MVTDKKNLKILIVDDDKALRGILNSALSLKGFVVEEAGNGRDALERISVIKPDLVILDCIMPVMDGFETCRWLKIDPKTQDIPVIFYSATHIEEARKLELGADDYLEKPFSIKEFFVKVDRVIKKQKTR